MTLRELHEVCHAFGDFVCPLYDVKQRRARLVGTGVPMRIGNLAVIVTATHVAEQFDERPFVTIGRETLLEVGRRRIGYKYIKNERVDTDLAIIELTSAEASEMRQRFSFSIAEDVADVVPPNGPYALYVLVGYPYSHNKPKPTAFERLRARTTYVVSNKLAESVHPYSQGKHDNVHFGILAPAADLTDASLTPITLPKAQGMSGGGVWQIIVDRLSGSLGAPKLVGIGIEHNRQHEVFIATRVPYVLPLLQDLTRVAT